MIAGRLGFLFDETAIRWLQDAFGTIFPLPFELVSLLGDTWGLLLVLGIALWRYDRATAYAVAAAILTAAPAWLALTSLFSVARPAGPGIVVFERLEAGAFPSGHVFHAMVAWGILARRTTLAAWVPPVVGIATGIGRIYMGVHFPADVLASLVLGPLFVLVFLWAWDRLPDLDVELSTRGRVLTLLLVMAAVTLLVLGPLEPERLRRWEIVGVAYAAPVALLVQRVWPLALRTRVTGAARTLLAVGGLAVIAATSRLWVDHLPALGALTTGLAVFWIFVLVPALVVRPDGRSG